MAMRPAIQVYSFTDNAAAGLPVPGDRIDAQTFQHNDAINDVQGVVAGLTNADGSLKTGIVTLISLSPEVSSSITASAVAAVSPYATAAAASAASASASAASATTSATTATSAKVNVNAIVLGNRATPPGVDNNGNTLTPGAIYYDTGLAAAMIYGGPTYGWQPITLTGGTATAVSSFNSRVGAISLVSGDVIAALGYTPYNASNPNGYLSSINSLQVTTALGYTPVSATTPNFTANVSVATGAADATLTLNSTGAFKSALSLSNAGALKWQVGKDSADGFYVYDSTGARNVFSCAPSGVPAFGAGLTSGGSVTVGYASPVLTLAKTASGQTNVLAGKVGTSLRWSVALGDAAAEAGANAGSAFTVSRYDDTGAYIDAPLTIDRKTGQAYFPQTLYIGASAHLTTNGDLWMPWANQSLSGGLLAATVCGTWGTSTDGKGRLNFNANAQNIYKSGATGNNWHHNWQDNSGRNLGIFSDNSFYASGNIVAYWSDARLKEQIKRVAPSEGLSRVLGYEVVDYSWNEKGRELTGRTEGERERGLLAQDAKKINPEAVTQNPLGEDENGEPYFTLREQKIIFDLIGAVQAQQAEIETLKTALNLLTGGRF